MTKSLNWDAAYVGILIWARLHARYITLDTQAAET